MAVWLVVLGQAIVLALIWAQRIEFGSRAGHWVYRYIGAPHLPDVICGFVVVSLLVAFMKSIRGVIITDSLTTEVFVVLSTFFLGTLVELWIRSRYQSRSLPSYEATANGFYSAALRTDVGSLLRHFQETVSSLPPMCEPTCRAS
jgi:hypothetical protein